MRVAVTGTAGQVVMALMRRGGEFDADVIAVGRPYLDLSQPQSVFEALSVVRPQVIVSAAAYTAVDQAEKEPDLAEAINGRGAGLVAKAAARLKVPLVHLSTDYVFDGTKTDPYLESDPTGPVGAYGRSKLAGEQAIAEVHDNHAILRTAWVYSPFGKNFVKTMLRLAIDHDEVAVVGDQSGTPTSALDIADGVLAVARNLLDGDRAELRGVFHMTGRGETNWAGFAEAVFAASQRLGGPFARVRPITTAEYPTPARRPANSRLDCAHLAEIHDVRLPDWRQSSDAVVAELIKMGGLSAL